MKKKILIVVGVFLISVMLLCAFGYSFKTDKLSKYADKVANFFDELVPDKSTSSEPSDGHETYHGLIFMGDETTPGYGKIIYPD